MRGHKVVLLEQGKRLGGQLLIAAKAPGRDSFEDQVYFEENEMIRLGVDVRLETRVDLALIKSLAPDTVVIATGSLPRVPEEVAGITLPHVAQGWDVMLGKVAVGERVALVSQEDYYQTPCVAEYLAERGKKVDIFHKSVHLATEVARYSIGMVLNRMEKAGVTVHPNLMLTAVKPDELEFVSSWGGSTLKRGLTAWSSFTVRCNSPISTISCKPTAVFGMSIWPGAPGYRAAWPKPLAMAPTSA
jgi:NADPH-dependent 2,4-dienoyl-CoA reductase/sulfur reductase-like enzyme